MPCIYSTKCRLKKYFWILAENLLDFQRYQRNHWSTINFFSNCSSKNDENTFVWTDGQMTLCDLIPRIRPFQNACSTINGSTKATFQLLTNNFSRITFNFFNSSKWSSSEKVNSKLLFMKWYNSNIPSLLYFQSKSFRKVWLWINIIQL